MTQKNPAHLDNFKQYTGDQFRIVDVTSDAVRGTQCFTISSGKTKEQAIERFYGRFMFRKVDQEMILTAQKYNRLKLQHIVDNHCTLIEDQLMLIA